MRAHSQELRQRVLRAVDEGTSRAEIIERFQVSRATIKRYLKQRRETGNVQPRPIPGRPNVVDGKDFSPGQPFLPDASRT